MARDMFSNEEFLDFWDAPVPPVAGDGCNDDAEPGALPGNKPDRGQDRSPTTQQSEPGGASAPVPAPMVPLFSWDDIEQCEATYKKRTRDGDQQAVIAHVLRHLRAVGIERSLSVPHPAWRCRIDDLERLCPNFGEYLDFLRTAHALAEKEGTALHLSPSLLCGAPGLGKTFLSEQVADLLGTSFQTIRIETAQDNSELAGSSDFWSSSRPGAVFNKLVFSNNANPLFLLDEIDKSTADRFDPLAPLYCLLETHSARSFRDLAHRWLGVNAEFVQWIATANDLQCVPAPLVSRMKVFDVPAPTPTQAMSIAGQLWRRLCDEMPKATAGIELTESALHALSLYSPRGIRKALREALGRAVYHQRERITAADISPTEEATRARKCGFV